ncbi:MAG: protease, partial [Phaeodactylibacter sp.]|nr:protease [Phaeodactylibacter sp.]
MKFSNLLLLAIIAIALMTCSKTELGTPENPVQESPMTKAEMNQIIEETLLSTNTVYYWKDASTRMLWSASVRSDSMMSLGYQPAGFEDIESRIHEIDLTDDEWSAAKNQMVKFVVEATNAAYPDLKVTAEDLFLNLDEEYLPTLDVKIFNESIIERLREMPEVRYIEPLSYSMSDIERRSGSGCGYSPANNIPSSDFTTVTPNAKIPWNFSHPSMNVPGAWSTSTGSGIKVALIDTGTSPNQNKLGSQFNSGFSGGRSLERLGTHISGMWWWASNDGPNDGCGHGTQM